MTTIKRKICIEFKLEDFWIGLFWRKSQTKFDLWICLIPCIPIHYARFEEKLPTTIISLEEKGI